MKTFGIFKAALVIGAGMLILGSAGEDMMAFAESADNVAIISGITPEVKTALFYLADPVSGHKGVFDGDPGWRGWLHKSIFPDSGLADKTEKDIRVYWILSGESERLSVGERMRREDMAREEAYKVMANMAMSFEPVAKLRDMIEPFTKPVEVYKAADGEVTTSYFGQSGGGNGTRLFAVNVGLSASHNVNLMFDVYETFNVSYIDGRRLEMSYAEKGSAYAIGFQQEDMDKFMLIYRFRF